MLTLLSPAKLNLLLAIIGQRDDGYHLLQSIFQVIDFADELTFDCNNSGNISLTPGLADVSLTDNLIYRAAKLLQTHTHCQQGVDIMIDKRLPCGAGLGGGSSNAATTLVALNELWQCRLSNSQLRALGLQLGADVPFFIFAQNAFVEGIGERLQTIALPETWFVIILSPVNVSTKKIFHDPQLTRNTTPCTIRALPAQWFNDIEAVACRTYPLIADALHWLRQYATNARLTGSGSAIFAECADRASAEKIAQQVIAPWQAIVAKGLQKSPIFDFAYRYNCI